MMQTYIGIDCGSATCKGVLLKENTILAHSIKPTGWSPKTTASEILNELLASAGTPQAETKIVATGYGRVGIPFANRSVTEITCHAKGAQYIFPDVKTVIDIGGQDSKVISVENGKVLAFQMNDKCAAGTGRFVEMSAHRMGLDMAEFAEHLQANQSCTLSSTCAVFADSEIVSLLSIGKTREEIVRGVINAMVAKVITLAAKIDIRPPVVLTGGLAALEGLRFALEKQLNCPVLSSDWSRYAGAIGAALVSK